MGTDTLDCVWSVLRRLLLLRFVVRLSWLSCLIPVRRGIWGNKIGLPHTLPYKMTRKCGSVTMSGLFFDCRDGRCRHFVSRGSTKTLGKSCQGLNPLVQLVKLLDAKG
ncbi:40S ribosomal protein S2-2 [Linum perenne]